jgi:hypothetical protein
MASTGNIGAAEGLDGQADDGRRRQRFLNGTWRGNDRYDAETTPFERRERCTFPVHG